jgi:SAM-dependent methyltransferase
MSELTAGAVERMHYSELVALIGERNRPSGGVRTVHSVAVHSFLTGTSRVLEIGSNTGFTSVNLTLLCGSQVVGIDVNGSSIVEAKRYAAEQGVDDRVTFIQADATALPLDNGSFDLVWASNVTSFVEDKKAAISEYLRVLTKNGYLAVVPIYYVTPPPATLVDRVAEAINARLRTWTRGEWIGLFQGVGRREGKGLELVFDPDYSYLDQAPALDAYCERLLDRPRIRALPSDVRQALARRYRECIALFNENLRYCGYSILLFQKRIVAEEEELFHSSKRYHDSETSSSAAR